MGRKIRNFLIGATLAGLVTAGISGIQSNRYPSSSKTSQVYVAIGVGGVTTTALGLVGLGIRHDYRSSREDTETESKYSFKKE